MTLYCRRVMRLVVRSALNTPANLSLTDLHGGGVGWGGGGGTQGGVLLVTSYIALHT
jgi:hypothetical protein